MRTRLQNWTVYQLYYWRTRLQKSLMKTRLQNQYISNITEYVYKTEQYIRWVYKTSVILQNWISNITVTFTNYWWEHVYKTESVILLYTFTWTVYQQYYWWEYCISVILLMRTRLQNWTVYQ